MMAIGVRAFPVPFRSFAGEHYFGITGPVPENAFGRSLSQQLSHLVGEFFGAVAEQVRRGVRHGEVTGHDALDIPHEVGDAGGEDHPWRAEPGAGQGVLEAEGLNRRGALARSPRRSEVLPHQLLDLIVRNPRRPGARRDGPPSGPMPDQDQSAARLDWASAAPATGRCGDAAGRGQCAGRRPSPGVVLASPRLSMLAPFPILPLYADNDLPGSDRACAGRGGQWAAAVIDLLAIR